MENQLQGCYTLVYANGEYRTLRFREGKNNFAGKVIASLKVGNDFSGFAFLKPDNTLAFWKKFVAANPPERLKRIERAVSRIVEDPTEAQKAYAVREGKCARCQRQLTVPASLHAGLGPECAGKVRWTKKDQNRAFDWLAAEAARPANEAAA